MAKTYDVDVRYGSSFLDVSKNRQSVSGEIMTDKITGEVYIKRPNDNKIISFRQKSQTLYEAIQEFNIQFQSSIGFTHPENPGSYLLGTKLDVDEFLPNENKTDILMNNHVFSESYGTYKDFRFEVSEQTNGFFIKPITRLGDRNVCGYLTGQFSEHEYINFSTVIRSFTDWLELSTLYESAYLYTEWKNLEKWSSSNALIDCTIKVMGIDENGSAIENTKSFTRAIQLNEYSFIGFPEDYNEEMVSIYSINVIITKIYAPKLEYERYLANDNNATSGISSVVDRMMEVDDRVILQSVEAFYFITSGNQLPINENTLINQCIDVEFLDQAIVYLSTSSGARAVQSQVEEPEAWPIDTVWAEELRYIENGNVVKDTDSVNKFSNIEKSLYHDPEDIVEFTDEVNNAEGVYIKNLYK